MGSHAVTQPSPDALARSYAACRRVVRRSGSNLCGGFLLLPAEKRRAMDALYAFMRRTDDLVDNPRPAHLRRQAMVEWRAALEHALLGCFDRAAEPAVFRWDATAGARCEDDGGAILPALADAVHRFAIPPDHLRALLDGIEMDLHTRRYETFDELRQYCERVASAVGLACIHVWGFRGGEALESARQAGVALQLTNILRDLRDDAEQDRVYLPQEDFRACGYTVDDLLARVADERFHRLMELEIDRAEGFYRRGATLLDLLEPDGRRVFGIMTSVYHALLDRIRRRPADVLTRRVALGRASKLRIALRWTLFPPRTGAAVW
jgi:15-cis-phytoene synthase